MNPTTFKQGIRLLGAAEDNSKLKLVAIDDNGVVQYYITEIPASMLPPIAITSVILASETTISDFAANSGNYTFEQGDVIVLDNGNGSYYMYNGGTKTDVNSYNQITASDIDWSQIVNIPVEVRSPSLEVVLNNGNISPKGIIIGKNIVVAPVGSPVTSTGSNSIGFTANDKFFITQVPENGGKLLSFDISNLTASREIDIPDFGGTLPLLSPTETNDGDLAITGSFTGKGDGLTDVDASELGGELPTYYNFRNFGLGTEAIPSTNWDTITETGLYTSIFNVTVGTPVNAGYMSMIHIQTSLSSASQYTVRLSTGDAWQRVFFGGSWSPWVEIITEDNISDYTGLPAGFYEEGTFTPTLSGGSYTFNTVRNDYIRIGNKKTFYFTLSNINGTGNSGQNLSIGVGELLSDLCESTLRRIAGSDITEEYKCEITNIAGNSVFIKKGDDLAQSNVDFTSGVLSGSITIITNVYTP